MLPDLEKLLVLHDRDSRQLTLEKTLEQIPKDEARVQDHLKNDLASVANVKESLQKNAMAMKTLELDIETRRTTISRLKTQQFETKKNEEYRTLEGEVARYAEQVDELETQQLELMDETDSLNTDLTAANEALAKTQKLVDEELADFASKRENCQAEIKELMEERQTLSADIPSPTVSLYERLLKSKEGQALAEVSGGQCKGCHIKLVKSTLSTLRADKEIAQCENCSRMLYEI